MTRWRLDSGQIEVIDDITARILRAKKPAERVQMIFDANRLMRQRIEGALRTWHPDWSDHQIRLELARRMTRGAS